MLRLSSDRNELNIVADQFGGPTSAKSIAKTLVHLIDVYQKDNNLKWGTYHYCGKEQTSWCDFAKEIFKQAKAAQLIKKDMRVNAISTAEYPTLAKRPENSMLDCSKIKNTFGIEMPNWRVELKQVLSELN